MDSSDACLENTPPSIKETAENVMSNLLPKKSKDRHTRRYNNFKKWCTDKKVKNTSENILIAYFDEISSTLNSSTLWSVYSMLKTTLNINDNLDISQYKKLKTYIKRKSEYYIPKKSEIFTREEINKFLHDAPNDMFLMMKVVFVIGISGACRSCELVQLELSQIKFLEDFITINIANTKNNVQRTFFISNEIEP
uniref:Tyr recombinase domain-containing protein n=1 Tax=Rhodnius prolixus TaxID=13249 RepID=T1HTE2_RHOPR